MAELLVLPSVPAPAPIASALQQLRVYFLLPEESSVEEVLSEEPALTQILVDSVPHLKSCFGSDAVLALRAPLDDSGVRELYALVLWPGGVDELRSALARFDESFLFESPALGANLTFTYELV